MGETNSPLVAHVGYDISSLKRVKFNSLEWRNIVTHGQLKENLYLIPCCQEYKVEKQYKTQSSRYFNGLMLMYGNIKRTHYNASIYFISSMYFKLKFIKLFYNI